MNTKLSDALKEAYAVAPSDVAVLETIEVRHASLENSLYLVRNREDIDLTLETGQVVTFSGTGFRLALPASGSNGLQELTLLIDNVDRRVSDLLQSVLGTTEPVEVLYRPYLSNDTTRPQMDPPLVLYLSDVTVTVLEVTCRATFADVLNRKFPTDYYTRRRFPSLGD